MSIGDDLQSGRLANVDTALWVRESTIAAGAAAGTRAIDIAPWAGVACRIYPDRGLDIGQAWYRGQPLAWVSQVGEAPPLKTLHGTAWSDAFGGGLMTTCGLRNVGMPSEGHGLHGTYSHLPAHDVEVSRRVDSAEWVARISGTIWDRDSPEFALDRTIELHAERGLLEVEDTITNHGDVPGLAPMLYHFNFGYPLWAPPAQLEIPVVSTTARDPASEVALGNWRRPPPVEAAPERVLEHDVGTLDYGWARIVNNEIGVVLRLSWDRSTLPRLNQWLDPNPNMAVLGIEPANCSTRGRAADRERGILPILEPGESRTTRVVVEAYPTAA
ncbi:MAG: aldose 1-epimerase family protein [Acidimicrobiia bacterium]|nr:aldose 1-epimerase family protein [Acidimicrobiia bacterium]